VLDFTIKGLRDRFLPPDPDPGDGGGPDPNPTVSTAVPEPTGVETIVCSPGAIPTQVVVLTVAGTKRSQYNDLRKMMTDDDAIIQQDINFDSVDFHAMVALIYPCTFAKLRVSPIVASVSRNARGESARLITPVSPVPPGTVPPLGRRSEGLNETMMMGPIEKRLPPPPTIIMAQYGGAGPEAAPVLPTPWHLHWFSALWAKKRVAGACKSSFLFATTGLLTRLTLC
jgi:hypothetical protein